MPENAVYVGRPTKWGNPFGVGPTFTRAQAVEAFARYLAYAPMLRARLCRELRGKDLCCWCPLDQPCHADILLKIANR